MQDILFEYEMHPTTWAYLSSLMTIGIFFRFRRVWSVRNLDLIGLIVFSPGLLLVSRTQHEQWGYVWLFCVGGFFLVRLLLDPVMVRRPLLAPNLSASGLTFTGVALFVFLTGNVMSGKLIRDGADATGQANAVVVQRDVPAENGRLAYRGPGYPMFYRFAGFAYETSAPVDKTDAEQVRRALMRTLLVRMAAVVAHLAVVLGIVLIGFRHFGNIQTGVAVASLYLLLPYAAQMTNLVDHVVPAVLLVWAVAAYRRPLLAGIAMGLAGGTIFYPLFLLPLWCGFYWRRGLLRFIVGAAAGLALLVGLLQIGPESLGSFADQLQQMFGWRNPMRADLVGFWHYHEPVFRIPVMAAFVALCVSLALWPAQKNLGTLLSCSAAVMLGIQFWKAEQGGLYMAWYLPLLLLTVFRPNLEDRVAVTAVAEPWYPWRKKRSLPAAETAT